MLKKRIISAVTGIILIYLIIKSSGIIFFSFLSILTLFALGEFCRITGLEKVDYVFHSLVGLIYLYFSYLNNKEVSVLPFILLILLYLFIRAFREGPDDIINRAGKYLLAFFYVPFLLSFALLILNQNFSYIDGEKILWLALFATWASDSGAYFAGIYLGKRPLAPKLSPKKSVAGSTGGFLLTGLTTYLISLFWQIPLPGYLAFFLGFVLSFSAQAGDLIESALKRDAGIKDSGNIIPGHGGVLDRIDSLLIVLPVVYLFFDYLL